ncbi:MAG: 7,8-didemethyl-8-hydroxy-5-deazariboflavin synthase subunit CofG [Synechococcaceae cyanobacterium RM1_1_27]|nr:7,8-didemethyl-8-hydroxy-5-deazariboflavin synthase subunit CofG [Synechococcaceae cyanobacterium RM1_1_27]
MPPDKHPHIRLQMTAEAGKLGIPFTSGLLVGMGETPQERVQTLVAIRQLHQAYGHIQEVIVQPFRIGSMTPVTAAPEPSDEDVVRTIALARLILPPEVSVQTPPNLNATLLSQLIQAGINDFGGISPLTPDYINPDHRWPHLDQLAQLCTQSGFQLQPRLPIYPQYQHRAGFLAPQLQDPVRVCQDQLSAHLPPAL